MPGAGTTLVSHKLDLCNPSKRTHGSKQYKEPAPGPRGGAGTSRDPSDQEKTAICNEGPSSEAGTSGRSFYHLYLVLLTCKKPPTPKKKK